MRPQLTEDECVAAGVPKLLNFLHQENMWRLRTPGKVFLSCSVMLMLCAGARRLAETFGEASVGGPPWSAT